MLLADNQWPLVFGSPGAAVRWADMYLTNRPLGSQLACVYKARVQQTRSVHIPPDDMQSEAETISVALSDVEPLAGKLFRCVYGVHRLEPWMVHGLVDNTFRERQGKRRDTAYALTEALVFAARVKATEKRRMTTREIADLAQMSQPSLYKLWAHEYNGGRKAIKVLLQRADRQLRRSDSLKGIIA